MVRPDRLGVWPGRSGQAPGLSGHLAFGSPGYGVPCMDEPIIKFPYGLRIAYASLLFFVRNAIDSFSKLSMEMLPVLLILAGIHLPTLTE